MNQTSPFLHVKVWEPARVWIARPDTRTLVTLAARLASTPPMRAVVLLDRHEPTLDPLPFLEALAQVAENAHVVVVDAPGPASTRSGRLMRFDAPSLESALAEVLPTLTDGVLVVLSDQDVGAVLEAFLALDSRRSARRTPVSGPTLG